MRYAIDVPNYGDYFDPRGLATLAHEAEESGWDGFFVWDHISLNLSEPICDPWVALSAIAILGTVAPACHYGAIDVDNGKAVVVRQDDMLYGMLRKVFVTNVDGAYV